jgi:hypothetical protein
MSAPCTYPPSQHPHGSFASAPLAYLEGRPVSFGEAVKQAFRNAYMFRGRASRSARLVQRTVILVTASVASLALVP